MYLFVACIYQLYYRNHYGERDAKRRSGVRAISEIICHVSTNNKYIVQNSKIILIV